MKDEPTTSSKTALYQQIAQVLIFVQALVATVGSMYYSTFGDPVKNFGAGNLFPYGEGLEPCVLCWFARILMYPIAIISYVGIAKQDKKFTDYVLALSIPGVLLELYHYALQKFPIPTFFTCSAVNPCNALQVDYFGFITIPFLALVAFSVITAAAILNKVLANKK